MTIPGFSAYDITEEGVVTHLASGRVMKHTKTVSRRYYTYVRVSLINDEGKQQACSVLRLLALAFLEKPNGPCIARAKDGNNANIKLSNVEWVSYAQSTLRAWKNGKCANRRPRQSTCCTKDTMEMVLNALEQFDEPVTNAELCRILDVPYSTVRYTMKALVHHGKAKYVHGKGHILA